MMEVKVKRTLIYRIELTEDEVDSLISSLSIAKSDWNTSDIANEVLSKLIKIKENG